jgi:Dolichyl-phosphate-mannose-protein mannosyltransferase
MRIFQFLLGVVVAYICFLIAKNLFGIVAGMMASALALALPTLVFISTELQTEQLATFLIILFLFFLFREIGGKKNCAVAMGLTSGFVTLVRFNAALLPIIGAIACLWSRRSLKDALVLWFVAGLIVSPWIVHNAEVFHGKVLFSSHGGINFLEGILTPDGRAQNGEGERVRAAVGWLHTDIEMNSSHRLLFPSEDQLDNQARAAAIRAWESLSWTSRIRLLTGKCATFWLSTDQLLETGSFSGMQRRLRATGVVIYWILLALALVGWVRLFSSSRVVSLEMAFYVVFVTLAHLPFVMNTRLRIPFIDPLLSILAAGGLMSILGHALRLPENGIQKKKFLLN